MKKSLRGVLAFLLAATASPAMAQRPSPAAAQSTAVQVYQNPT